MARLHQLCLALALTIGVPAGAAPRSVIADPPRDARHPAHNQQLVILSHGAQMNALLFQAQGPGPKPTVILLHGLPGNERNLDLAQAIRRIGWDVLTFTYRGAWGSEGSFSLGNAIDDAAAALDLARSAEGAKLGIDPTRIVIAGHSMGGGIAALTAAHHDGLAGLILLDAWNFGETAHEVASSSTAKEQFVAGQDDFGHALAGATPQSLADELAAHDGDWNLYDETGALRATPILDIYATFGGAQGIRPLAAAFKRAGNRRVTAIQMDSDHPFADHRIALAKAVAAWLQALPRR